MAEFTRPLEPKNVTEQNDPSLGMDRTEVKSAQSGSHLGHVFPDGPAPTDRVVRINSASLRVIPKAYLEKAGRWKISVPFCQIGYPALKRGVFAVA